MEPSELPSIVAIIPTYNRSAFLKESIDSILLQSRPVDEIIVVNDGSTDDTEDIVKSYGSRVTLITKKNGGKSSALNLALAQCTSDYIWICDDDDLAAPEGVECLAALLDTDDSIDFVFGDYLVFHDEASGRKYAPPAYRARKEEPNISIRFLEGMFTNQYAMLVRRSLYLKVGTFREDLIRSQDYEMAIRLSRSAKAAYVPKVIFYYRQHAAIRGSAADFFPAEKSLQKWVAYEHQILTWVKQEYHPKEFTPTFALQWEDTLARRAALLQRAYIFSRRGMWMDVVDDFCDAVDINPAPAVPEELHLVELTTYPTAFWEAIGRNPQWMSALSVCYRKNAYGRVIVHTAARPLVWQGRHMLQKGNIVAACRALRRLVKLLGIWGAFHRVLSSMIN